MEGRCKECESSNLRSSVRVSSILKLENPHHTFCHSVTMGMEYSWLVVEAILFFAVFFPWIKASCYLFGAACFVALLVSFPPGPVLDINGPHHPTFGPSPRYAGDGIAEGVWSSSGQWCATRGRKGTILNPRVLLLGKAYSSDPEGDGPKSRRGKGGGARKLGWRGLT